MRFSLVVATLNRVAELQRLLLSLVNQSFPDFEIVVVDQNADGRIDSIIRCFARSLTIIHLHQPPGASLARNVGIAHACGELIAFPDDDCWYPPHLLRTVSSMFASHGQWDGIAGKCIDVDGTPTVNHLDTIPGRITRLNTLRRGSAATLFLRRRVTDSIGGFDQSMGPGAGTPWAAAEDLDLVVRAVIAGFHLRLLPSVCVWHGKMIDCDALGSALKRRHYSRGMGRLLRKHSYPFVFCLLIAIADAKGLILAAALGRKGKVGFYSSALLGLTEGWIGHAITLNPTRPSSSSLAVKNRRTEKGAQ